MPWDQEFARIEQAILRLTAGYDAFLYGAANKPPVEERRQLDATFRRLDAAEPESAADQFRLSTIQTRYTALCERWDRLQTEKEQGRRPGLYARFTRGKTPLPESGLNAPEPASVESSGTAPAVPRSAVAPERRLFDRYLDAKRARGEDVSGYDLEHFVETLERERQKIRDRVGDVDIEFDVREKDGRVRLVARRKGVETS